MLKDIDIREKGNFKNLTTLKVDENKRLIDAVLFVSDKYKLNNKAFTFLNTYDVNKRIKYFGSDKEYYSDSVYLEFTNNRGTLMSLFII